MRVAEFGAEHESYPLRRERFPGYVRPVRFATSATTIMESDINGGKISGIQYWLGAWYSFGRFETGVNHSSFHTIQVGDEVSPGRGATQSQTLLELRIKL